MIRKYSPSDKTKVLELLRLNTPHFFDPSEEKEFENYLDNYIEDYFVVEENAEVIGAGGINYFPIEKTARISWDIVHPNMQGKGIGQKLMQHRISMINNNLEINTIIVRTSQFTHQFYLKMGFELEKVEENFWAKDMHLYLMRLKS